LWPGYDPDSGERPPQPDWFVACELATDIGESVFALEGLDIHEPWIVRLVKDWYLTRRQAWAVADRLAQAARRTQD
jgi:hypothetical protein